MRKVILKQNERASGRLFELGSLLVYQDAVPVQYGFNFDRPNHAGYADRMKLDVASGEVSMDINLTNGYSWDQFPNGLFDFTIYADQVEARGSVQLNTQIISKCRLKAVVIVPKAYMPIPSLGAKK